MTDRGAPPLPSGDHEWRDPVCGMTVPRDAAIRSLSTLDGWWPEGCVDGLTGWSIGTGDVTAPPAAAATADARALYERLERDVLPRFYRDRGGWIEVMRHTVAPSASHFTHRMIQQYMTNAYLAWANRPRHAKAGRTIAMDRCHVSHDWHTGRFRASRMGWMPRESCAQAWPRPAHAS